MIGETLPGVKWKGTKEIKDLSGFTVGDPENFRPD